MHNYVNSIYIYKTYNPRVIKYLDLSMNDSYEYKEQHYDIQQKSTHREAFTYSLTIILPHNTFLLYFATYTDTTAQFISLQTFVSRTMYNFN